MMRSRRITAAALGALLAVAVPLPAGAHDDETAHTHEVLSASDVDASDYPVLEVVVSLPSSAGATAGDPAAYVVTDTDADGAAVTFEPEVVPLASTRLDVVLAIDTSGSMSGGALGAAKAAAFAFIAELPETARIALVGFGPEATVAAQLTNDRTVLADAIDSLVAGGETALYDALLAAALQVDQAAGARTALVVLSDGGDTVSASSLADSATVAADTFDVVHAVSLVTSEQDRTALDTISSGGGTVVQAEDPVALAGVYRDVADRIVNQYALRWETTAREDGDVSIAFAGDGVAYEATVTRDIDEAVLEVVPDPRPETSTADVTPTTPEVVETPAAPLVTEPQPVDNPSATGGWVLVVGVLLVAVSLFLAGITIFLPQERRRNLAAEFRQRIPRGRELTGAGRRFVEAVEQFLRRDPERHVGLALRLDRAGLDWSPAEFVAVLVAGGAVLALFGFGLGGLIGFLLLPALGVFGIFAWVDHKGRKRTALFTSQLDSTLQLMAGSLKSGFGIMQALGTVAEETEWPTCEEFTRVLGEVRLGRDMGAALRSSARRVASDDYDWVVQAIEISREVGGNLSEVLDNVSQTIRSRNTLRRQVTALSAEGRISALILFILPFVMLLWMRLSNPEYIQLLFDRRSGQIALVGAVVLMTVGALWMRKIIRVRF